MNRLHIQKQTWNRILQSRLYNFLRGKRAFD